MGGRENDLALYDIETEEPVFKARNVPNDWLQLRVPIWVTDMKVCLLALLSPSSSTPRAQDSS